MEKECKKILLLKGLQPLSNDQFSMVKSLLDTDLELTPKMKDDYTKVKIADLMQKKFRGITCVDKLLELLKDIEGLGDIVKTIRNERRKVMKKYKEQMTAATKKRRQEVSSTNESPSTSNEASGSVDGTPVSKKNKTQTTNNDKSKTMQPTQKWGQLPGLSVTVAASTESFPQPRQTPSPTPGCGSSTKKKNTQPRKTGKPEMMQPTQERGHPGQPSRTCELSPGTFAQPPQMPPSTPGSSSSTKKRKTQPIKIGTPEMMQPVQEWGQLGQPSVTGPLPPGTFAQLHQMPPSTPGSSSSTKKRKTQPIKIGTPEMMQPVQEWGQLGQPSVTGPLPPGTFAQLHLMPPSTPGSSSSTKVEENYLQKKKTTIKTENVEMMQPMQEWGQVGQPSVTGPLPPETFAQLHLMPLSTPGSSSSTKKPRLKAVPTKASREEGQQTGPKEVMVVKATEPFAYDVAGEEREMFHATVVTESQFFRVKVFCVGLREKFIPKRVISISDYFGRNGFLEVDDASSVSDVNADRQMEVSSRLIQNANATPKIKDLLLEEPGTSVSGVYQVNKKRVLDQRSTLYEIQDDTGKMDVFMYGRLTKINCEEGDKLTLICFEISGAPRILKAVTHSFIKVIKPRKNKKE